MSTRLKSTQVAPPNERTADANPRDEMVTVRKIGARVAGALFAGGLFTIAGLLWDLHPALCALTMLIGAPAAYFVPVMTTEAAQRRRLRELRSPLPRLTTSSEGTPTAVVGAREAPPSNERGEAATRNG